MAAIETIVELIKRNGAVNTPAFFEEMQSKDSKPSRLRYALEVIAKTEAIAPIEANAIKHYLRGQGYEVTVTDICTNWMDNHENNQVVKLSSEAMSRSTLPEGVMTPFVKNRIYDDLAQELGSNVSFSIVKDGNVIITARCAVYDNEINNFGLPVTLSYGTEDINLRRSALRTMLRHLRVLRRVYCAAKIRLVVDDIMSAACADLSIEFDAIRDFLNIYVDLTLEEREIWLHIRKSYRPLINQYRHRLLVTARNFGEVQDFFDNKFRHDISMQYQAYMMAYGAGALHVYCNEDQKIGAVIGVTDIVITRQCRLSYFNIGAFDKSEPCHYALYKTMMYLKKQSYHRFYLASCSTDQDPSTKIGAINFYKSGFSTHVDQYRVGITAMS